MSLRKALSVLVLSGALPAAALADAPPSMPAAGPDRTVLPIAAPHYPPITTLDARDATAPPIFEVKAPDGAPNVVIVLIDDLGFGGTSTFGGVIETPNIQELADTGLRYNQFHSTALCSPSRQAVKTGRNHHTANQAKITEVATAFPGATGQLPNEVAPLAKMLQYNGYSTGAFGKWHETAVWEISPSGPMDRWPHRQGFDRFYGFLGGETNQWSPAIYDNMNPIEPPADPDYHFMTDMTTKAIEWVEFQQALTPDKPFFVYFAPGAVHAPHHVPKSYIDKHEGQFDAGWDVIREQIYERQLAEGLIPPGTKLAGKPPGIADWADLSPDEQRLFARQAEVFAAYVDMTDAEIGRFFDAVDALGELDNTLVFYIIGDNGTSAEGGMTGLYNEMTYFNAEPEGSELDLMLDHYDDWGGPTTYPHMAAGWAVAFDAPFMWTKQVASNYGGTRQGLVVHWPAGIEATGELRQQWHHLIDVAPTVLEAAGLPEPRVVDGTPQRPIEGVSMMYSFDRADAADRHHIQYFEMFGNRGLYYDGWFAGTVHVTPWGRVENRFPEDTWELYHVAEDFSMADDVAAQYPEKLAELQDLFLAEAVKYNVLPLDDRREELFNPAFAGRPDLMFGRTSLTLREGMTNLLENDFINIKGRSFTIEGAIAAGKNANGVLVSQGGAFGGWSLYAKKGKLAFAYNYLGLTTTTAVSSAKLPTGESEVKAEIVLDDPAKLASGGTVTLYIDGARVGSARIPKTQYMIFSADESANVGKDTETAVSKDYTSHTSHFTGSIDHLVITVQQPQ